MHNYPDIYSTLRFEKLEYELIKHSARKHSMQKYSNHVQMHFTHNICMQYTFTRATHFPKS